MKNSGTILVHDKNNNSIILEWESIQGPEGLNQKIKSLTDLLIPTYVDQEFEFAFKKPEAIANDFMLQSLAPMLEDNVDWDAVKGKIKTTLTHFFENMNWSKHSKQNDINIFVIAKDQKSGQRLGMIQFFISDDFPKNNVKAALFGTVPSLQDKELKKLLIFSIFQIEPSVERVFLHTRETNQSFIDLCKDNGFIEFEGKLSHWIDLEYIKNS